MENDHRRAAGLLSLAGQRVLVTGASGNIGRGVALCLAESGASVLVQYCNDAAGADETLSAIHAAGGKASACQADLTCDKGVANLFAQDSAANKPVTGIVNNAGSYPVQGLDSMSSAEWQAVLAANLDTAFRVSREGARRMVANALPGAIVNIASIEGSDPAAGHAHYASAKAALLMLTRASALEYGAAGIRFNAVSPGLISRPGIEEAWPEGVARWQDRVPLGRMGQSADVANAVLFLLSDAAAWISGAEIKVDGGMSAVSRW